MPNQSIKSSMYTEPRLRSFWTKEAVIEHLICVPTSSKDVQRLFCQIVQNNIAAWFIKPFYAF